ncbi:MAG: TRAP transporter TatT component family protein [Polyangiales bacterium]
MQLILPSRSALSRLALVAFVVFTGCNLDRVAVNTTAGVLAKSEPVARSYWDWESAGYATPAGIIQFEGMHLVSPDNEQLSLSLLKSYMAYAYGWVMDSFELARAAGDFELAEHHKTRAYLMYSRARDLALRCVVNREPGFREHLNDDPKAFAAFLRANFDEDDLPALFWLMMSWTSAINNSPNSEDMSDMTALRVIAQWVVDKDPGYEDAGALVFLGGFESSLPKAFGGDPVKGKAYFDRALELTGRKNHIVLINFATLYAVSVTDRELYLKLLHEIIEAPDQGAPFRMSNKVARRRAIRALARTDELFYE